MRDDANALATQETDDAIEALLFRQADKNGKVFKTEFECRADEENGGSTVALVLPHPAAPPRPREIRSKPRGASDAEIVHLEDNLDRVLCPIQDFGERTERLRKEVFVFIVINLKIDPPF